MSGKVIALRPGPATYDVCCDLPSGTTSGLRVVESILDDVDDVAFCRMSSSDVVRHRLVSDIIDAYARWDSTKR